MGAWWLQIGDDILAEIEILETAYVGSVMT